LERGLGDYRRRAHQAAGRALQAQLQQRLTVRVYLLQTHETLFDVHNNAFRILGGVPRRGIYYRCLG